jgi:hypothetical protein
VHDRLIIHGFGSIELLFERSQHDMKPHVLPRSSLLYGNNDFPKGIRLFLAFVKFGTR